MLNVATATFSDQLFPAPKPGAPWYMTRQTEFQLLLAIVAAQVVILVGMIVLDGLPLVLGERVKLKVVPVDPRDLFRGDYVVLDYEFSRIEASTVRGMPSLWHNGRFDSNVVGHDVYIPLTMKGDFHETGAASVDRPTGGSYLHGRISGYNRVECGIEAYYVQEGEGRRLENLIRQRRLLAEVAVWHGQAKLVRLIE